LVFIALLKSGKIMSYEIQFDARRCGGAGECIAVCSRGVWEWRVVEFSFLGRKIRRQIPYPAKQELCVGCKKCEFVCPTGCVRVVEEST
jgi:2-oxoglutarate ferredoxin oxidoreductase subunit delta